MSDKRITRTQASKDSDLQKEVDEFNPFAPRKELPRGEEEYSLNLSTSSSKDTEPLNDTANQFRKIILLKTLLILQYYQTIVLKH